MTNLLLASPSSRRLVQVEPRHSRITTVESLQHRSQMKQLEIVLGAASALEELADAMRQHNDFGTVVHHLELKVSVDTKEEPDWSSPGAISLFAALGELAQLQSLQLQGLGCSATTSSSNALPLARLTQLLQHVQRARSLRSIVVDQVRFATSDKKQETVEFVAALVHLKRLRHFQWEECVLPNDVSVLRHYHCHNIFNVILRQTQLETICLKQHSSTSSSTKGTDTTTNNHSNSNNNIMGHLMRRDTAERLGKSFRLEELTLLQLSIQADALQGMAEKLHCNRNLRVLNLDLRFSGTNGVLALCHMFQHNTSITTTELWIPALHDQKTAVAWREAQCLSCLAECLTNNTTLLVMVLKSHHDNHDDGSFNNNQSIVDDDNARAFVTMLEANPFGPITLDLDQYCGTYAPLIQLHTYLNVERKCEPTGLQVATSPDQVSTDIWNRLLWTAVTAVKPVSGLYRLNALFQIVQQNPTVLYPYRNHNGDDAYSY